MSDSSFPTMTFNAPLGYRVTFEFQLFAYHGAEYLDIGDGFEARERPRLARFSGTDPPGNVTSVSNNAWIRVQSHCTRRSTYFNMVITAVNDTGIAALHSNTREEKTLCILAIYQPKGGGGGGGVGGLKTQQCHSNKLHMH